MSKLNKQSRVADFLNDFWNDKTQADKGPLFSLFSPELIVNSPLGRDVGLQNIAGIFGEWLWAFPDMEVCKIKIETLGDVVIANWESRAKHVNPFRGLPPSGNKIVYPGETFFCFEGDQVTRYACKVDLLDVYKQLGHTLHQEAYTDQAILIKDKKLLINKLRAITDNLLTVREIECLSLYLIGFSARQIARFLFISFRTVETHLHRAIHALGCFNRSQCLEAMLEKKLLALWQDLGKVMVQEYEARK